MTRTQITISTSVVEAVADAADDTTSRQPNELKKLIEFTGFEGGKLAAFCKLLHFEARQNGYWDQRNILFQEVNG